MSAWTDTYGPWAVVTGASDGIGRDLARRLAARGLHLVLVARRQEVLQALAAELRTAHGVEVEVVAADLSEPTAVGGLLTATEGRDVGLLVASAGFGTSGPFLAADLDAELGMLDVNCRAVLVLAHAFGRRFVARGRGGVILLGSLVGFQGVPFAAHYAATKAYIQTLAEGLHVELAPHGVDVLSCAPGPVASGFAQRADMRMSHALTPEQVGAVTLHALGRRMTVRPGWLSKVLEWSLKMPRPWRVRVMRFVMRGMTAHQRPSVRPARPRRRGVRSA